MIHKLAKSFVFALNGLQVTWKEEQNFKIEVIIGLFLTFLMFYFDFSIPEFIICILAITIVLSAEIVNTAIEDLCNKVEPNNDPIIAKVKDTMSAFVLVTTVGAGLVGILIFYYHFV